MTKTAANHAAINQPTKPITKIEAETLQYTKSNIFLPDLTIGQLAPSSRRYAADAAGLLTVIGGTACVNVGSVGPDVIANCHALCYLVFTKDMV